MKEQDKPGLELALAHGSGRYRAESAGSFAKLLERGPQMFLAEVGPA